MENLEIYNKVRVVPTEALKPITAGRLKGMSDINPMWRIKQLTELFGPVGFGWKPVIVDKRIVPCENTNEIAAFVDIEFYYKYNGEWSEAIYGTGGATFCASERNGLHMSDECFKMAYTDALSVVCKLLGVGADVYWDKDPTKYTQPPVTEDEAKAMIVGFGEYADMLLTEVYKKDIQLLQNIYNDKDCPDRVKEAINVLINMVKKNNEAKGQ